MAEYFNIKRGRGWWQNNLMEGLVAEYFNIKKEGEGLVAEYLNSEEGGGAGGRILQD